MVVVVVVMVVVVEDKQYRDSTGILANLYGEKNQAEADLKVALNTPVVNPTNDSLIAEVNDLKATMAAMTQDIEKLEKKEKKPQAKMGEKRERERGERQRKFEGRGEGIESTKTEGERGIGDL